VAVSADDPSGVEETLVREDSIACDLHDNGLPVKANSERKGVFDEQIVQLGAPDSEAGAGGKVRLNGRVTGVFPAPDEPDAVERMTKQVEVFASESELVERCQGIRQKSFAAGLVDGGLTGVCNFCAKAAPGRSDGACES
jgi:hypothetical protein